MAKKTPPFSEYPEWTEARYRQFVRSALRAAWNRWPPKYKCLNKGRKAVTGKKHRWEHQCNSCKKWFMGKDIQVDHINPSGDDKSWDVFISRLFVGEDKLQKLCKPCHQVKTTGEARERKEGKAVTKGRKKPKPK